MAVIEALDLAKAFGTRQVLEQVSFTVEAGQIFGLLGPNGAGKTTTMRLFLGLLRPGAGEALVFGAPLADRPDLRRRVGVLLEQSGMADRLTARENLAFYGALHEVGRETIDDRLGRAGLLDRADDRVGTFSTGMKRRLGLVRATLHDPGVLFLDEPSSGLDPAAQAEIRELITKLASESGAAVLWLEGVRSWETVLPLPKPASWNRELARMKMFDNLISNSDRNKGNLLVDDDWHLYLIDHSRAFVADLAHVRELAA